jgi:hypothetical protein
MNAVVKDQVTTVPDAAQRTFSEEPVLPSRGGPLARKFDKIGQAQQAGDH